MSMPQGINKMSRRGVLKGLGATGATAAAGGAGLLAMSGGAVASSDTLVDDTSIETADGEVHWVAVDLSGEVSWSGFDEPVEKARIQSFVEILDGEDNSLWGSNLINDTQQFDLTGDWGDDEEVETGRSGYIKTDADWGIVQKDRDHYYAQNGESAPDGNGYGLPQNPAPAHHLYVDEDGVTETYYVELTTVYMLFDANGNELTGTDGYPDRPESTGRFQVQVSNTSSTASIDSDGGTVDAGATGDR